MFPFRFCDGSAGKEKRCVTEGVFLVNHPFFSHMEIEVEHVDLSIMPSGRLGPVGVSQKFCAGIDADSPESLRFVCGIPVTVHNEKPFGRGFVAGYLTAGIVIVGVPGGFQDMHIESVIDEVVVLAFWKFHDRTTEDRPGNSAGLIFVGVRIQFQQMILPVQYCTLSLRTSAA